MEELIEKVEKLKSNLDNLDEVEKIKELNKKIMEDEELLNNIKLYNETKDERIKEKIINNKLFREYKHNENEINFIVLEINKKLKEITSKGKCC